MYKLPSNYIACTGLAQETLTSYVDTGVLPSDTISVNGLFSEFSNAGYLFGARNTNSNTSAGQLNLYIPSGATSYFGYRSARVAISNINTATGYLHVHTNANVLDVNVINEYLGTATGSTEAFTGTRSIYLYALNNAGSQLTTSRKVLHAFQISDNGALIRYYVPVYSIENEQFGLYDFINETFSPMPTPSADRRLYKVTVLNSEEGGDGYAITNYGEYVKNIYAGNGRKTKARITAVPLAGYEFLNWTNENNEIISNEIEIVIDATSDYVIKPNFIKKTNIEANVGYKCMGIKYGVADNEATDRDIVFANVVSANITTDLLEKNNSTIILENMPDIYQPNMMISLFNPKGKVVYCGIILSIDGNKLICRDPISLFNDDFLITEAYPKNTYSLLTIMNSLFATARSYNAWTSLGGGNPLTKRKFYGTKLGDYSDIPLEYKKVFNITSPAYSNGVVNFEDYVRELFNSFGVYYDVSLKYGSPGSNLPKRYYFEYSPTYTTKYDPIIISDNIEVINNVAITKEEVENTVLVIYNNAISSVRGMYGMMKNGEVSIYDTTYSIERLQEFIGYDNYKVKVLVSDDDIKTLIAQELTNSKYNHKITFGLTLDSSALNIETLKIGRPVNFYHKDKMYESVITNINFVVEQNDDVIHSVNVTLGKVRTKLTTKINLKKI